MIDFVPTLLLAMIPALMGDVQALALDAATVGTTSSVPQLRAPMRRLLWYACPAGACREGVSELWSCGM